MLKGYEELTSEQREELEVMFWYSQDLRKIHRLKEELRNFERFRKKIFYSCGSEGL